MAQTSQKWKEIESPKGQNERTWKPKRPKWKEMKAQKAKMKGNEGSKRPKIERKWKPKSLPSESFRSKFTLQISNFWKGKRAKFKGEMAICGGDPGHDGFLRQAKRLKGNAMMPKRPKWKEMKPQKAKMQGNKGLRVGQECQEGVEGPKRPKIARNEKPKSLGADRKWSFKFH